MGRPPLSRRVSYIPAITYFKPAGLPLRDLEENCLTIEELEAIRLKDLEDLEQEQCAEKMNVSRPTFVRILDSARKKIADALIKGKAVRIEGGNYELTAKRFRCRNNHEWSVDPKPVDGEVSQTCPTCKSEEITELENILAKQPYRGNCRQGKGRC